MRRGALRYKHIIWCLNIGLFCGLAVSNFSPLFAAQQTSVPLTLSRNLWKGMRGDDIRKLQVFLNQDPDTRVASWGPGSPGKETTVFGKATMRAVTKFQEKYRSTVLTPYGFSRGTGSVGPATRAQITLLTTSLNAKAGKSAAIQPPVLTRSINSGVTHLSVQVVSNSEIDLSWNAVSSTTKYILDRRTGSSGFKQIATIPAGTTSYKDSGLEPSTLYFYEIRADNTPYQLGSGITLSPQNIPPAIQPTPTAQPQPIQPQNQLNNTLAQSEAERQAKINRLIAVFLIGWSSNVVADRDVDWNIKSEGWSGFVNTHVKPALTWGVHRVELHNPFGALPNENMQFDQYLEAQAAGLTWLTDGFVDAWKPITSSGTEVICYLGDLEDDTDFTSLSSDQWFERFWASAKPCLDAGMSIGFDAVVLQGPNSIEYKGVQAVQAKGVKVYVESRPLLWTQNWWSYNIYSINSWWLRSNPALYEDAKPWAAPNSSLTGEILRLVDPPAGHSWSDASAWLLPEIKGILADNNSAVFGVSGLQNLNISIDDVIN